MAESRQRANARPTILSAAARVILRDGVSHLTLDAVAAEAGVSKGGLLYHFRTKEALVAGMIDAFLADFERAVEQRVDEELRSGAPQAGAWTRAYLRVSFEEEIALVPGVSVTPEQSASLLAAIATDPALLDPIREATAAWQDRIDADGIDPSMATVIRLACDGLAFAEMFAWAPPDVARRKGVLHALLALVRPLEPGSDHPLANG